MRRSRRPSLRTLVLKPPRTTLGRLRAWYASATSDSGGVLSACTKHSTLPAHTLLEDVTEASIVRCAGQATSAQVDASHQQQATLHCCSPSGKAWHTCELAVQPWALRPQRPVAAAAPWFICVARPLGECTTLAPPALATAAVLHSSAHAAQCWLSRRPAGASPSRSRCHMGTLQLRESSGQQPVAAQICQLICHLHSFAA